MSPTPPRRCLPFLLLPLLVTGCATAPPNNVQDACAIFGEKDGWFKNARDAEKRWGTPIHVQLAIVHQESRFRHDAKPPREKLFWFIPWFRSSSAYGFAQAKDETWDWYKEKTGNWGADRDDWEDAIDFVAWYGHITNRMLGISKWDARKLYLAYHEGHGGYKRGTYNDKQWLLRVAEKVEANAARYRAQLAQCREELDSGWSVWPF